MSEIKCNPDPLAPHGFNRNASHNEGRHVCECESWDKLQYQADLILAMALLLNQHGIEPNSTEILAAIHEIRRLKNLDVKDKVAKFKCEFCGEISVTIHLNEEKTKTWAECSNCHATSS